MPDTTEPMTIDDAAEGLLFSEENDGEQDSDDAIETVAEDETIDTDEEDGADEADADGEDDISEEDDDDQGAEDFEEPADTYTVTVDGEERQVTLDDLKRSFSGQGYIQKGMQEAASAKKQAAELYESLQTERQQVLAMAAQLSQTGLTPPVPPSREMSQTDPIGYIGQKAAYDEQMAEYNRQSAQLQALGQQQAQEDARRQAEYMQSQVELLSQMIPEYADPAKRKELGEKLRDVGKHYDFTEEEIASVVDARHVRVLNDARKWRELQAAKSAATKKVAKARPVVKAGAKPKVDPKTKARDKLRAKLRETGDSDAAAALLMME